MNRKEHLLTLLAEECIEIAKETSKALRFGVDDRYPIDSDENNAESIVKEFYDLNAVMDLLYEEEPLIKAAFTKYNLSEAVKAKQEKIEKYLLYSKEKGLLNEEN